ncbi:MAG TPA: hypothetical protein VFX96_16075 [Pyrinomonadaceae bacterium]|nr:hypothetical protein [Pyrinomonadaceae bacterium]
MRLTKSLLGLCAATLALAACGGEVANTNTRNTSAPNVNASPSANASPASPTDTGAATSAREPERYRATYVFSGQTTGTQAASAQTTIEVARDGANRRWAFDTRFPGVGKVTILDRADKRYLIVDGQKRYVELTPEMTGFNVPRTMTPGMMVEQVQRQPNVENLGEEQVGGRTAIKYRAAGAAATGTQAGQVRGETLFWIDKETGLPLKMQAATSGTGQVQGTTGATGGMELRDLSTTVDAALFELPAGYTAMSEQEIRQLQQGAGMVLQAILGMMGGGAGGAASTPPATAATPAATASPAGH